MNESKNKLVHEVEEVGQESDLIDIIGFLRVNILVLAICTFLGIAGGLTIFAYAPYKWRADITLQIGKMPVLQQFEYIDPPAEVVEKIQSPLFLNKMATLMYGHEVDPDSPEGKLLYKDLKASVVNGGGLVSIHVFGQTAKEAYKNAGVIGTTIVDEHRAMEAPYIQEIQKRLEDATTNLARNRDVLRRLDSMEREAPARTETNALLKLTLIDAKASEIQALQAERTRLEMLLSATNLQQTKIVGKSLLPRKPVSPRLGILILGGGVIGCMLGILLSAGLAVHRRSAIYK